MDRGNADKHRTSIPGVKGRVVEEQKWGRETARERTADYRKNGGGDVAPPLPKPHAVEWGAERGNMNNQGRARDWADDTASDWRRGMGKGEAEGKPNFDHRGKDGKPDKW